MGKLIDAEILEIIERQPTVEPEPSQVARNIATIIENEQDMRVISERKTGWWIYNDKINFPQCSECGMWIGVMQQSGKMNESICSRVFSFYYACYLYG